MRVLWVLATLTVVVATQTAVRRARGQSRAAAAALAALPTRHEVLQLVRRVRSADLPVTQLALVEPKQMQKERRILRKKKKRLRELRQEIRLLTHQLNGGVPTTAPTGSPRWKAQQDKWKRKIYEKMKGIMRRLDRLERAWGVEDFDAQPPALPPARDDAIKAPRQLGGRKGNGGGGRGASPKMKSTTIATPVTLLAAGVASADEIRNEKVKRLQSSIDQLRTGENGTACATHSDCKPGRCCVREKSETGGGVSSVCTFNGLPEAAPCRDSCQCADRLHCFQPNNNQTQSICKKAAVVDLHTGYYLNRPSTHFAISSKKKKKR